jgi:hypothetical protein
MLFKFHPLWIISIAIIGAFSIYYADAQSQEVSPEVVQYRLKLAEGILETCYTKDPTTRSLIPNPALPIVSDLANPCEEKMHALDDFLAEFVDDEDGEAYAEYKESKSKPQSSEEQSSEEQSSEEQALTVSP